MDAPISDKSVKGQDLIAFIARSGPGTALFILVLVLWELAIRLFHVSIFIVPAPSDIATSLVVNAGLLAGATLITAKEILIGFLFAIVVGVALALLIVRFRLFGRALYPLIVLFQTVPKVALAPILILWFGYDLAPKVILIMLIAFFPVTLGMLGGLQSVEQSFVSLMRSVGARENDILLRVRIPHALPHLMAGMKVAITLCVIGAIVGEFAGASAGLGYAIQFASTQLDTAMVFAALVIVSIVGVFFYYLIEILERLLIPWAPKFDAVNRT
jgi:NitT/TauT family transport system permease protein